MDADSFHRLAKVLADSGEAETVEAAQAAFAAYGVRIVLDESVADDVGTQVVALTAINAASRSFLGNVFIDAPADMMLHAPGFMGRTLGEFAAWAGVMTVSRDRAQTWPKIHIGAAAGAGAPLGGIRPWADGWHYGIGPKPSSASGFFAPSCVAAAGLAVSEAFSMLRHDNPYADDHALRIRTWSCYPPRMVRG